MDRKPFSSSYLEVLPRNKTQNTHTAAEGLFQTQKGVQQRPMPKDYGKGYQRHHYKLLGLWAAYFRKLSFH